MFSWIQYIIDNPVAYLSLMLFRVPAILLALMLHECAHGYMALRCGDPTAQMLGRLTLNPLKHLDPLGTILMLTVGFGWARPVPINPRNFRDLKQDTIKVSLAGIVTNLTLFLFSMALMVSLNRVLWKPEFIAQYGTQSLLHGELNIFTWPVLNGVYNDFFKTPWLQYLFYFLMSFAQINLGLAIFNLLPVPPLDGYRVLGSFMRRSFLPPNYERAGIGILMLLSLTGILSNVMSTVMNAVQSGVLSLFVRIIGG